MPETSRIVVLCVQDPISAAIINFLRARFGEPIVIVERREKRSVFLRRRLRKLGAVPVLGQILFAVLAMPVLKRVSGARIAEIAKDAQIDTTWPSSVDIRHVDSVNGPAATALIEAIRPEVVVINGTRIIAKRMIDLCDCPIINIHCGITPKYRGVHGGYWALAQGDDGSCGVTIHMVSPGVDTGDILAQRTIRPTERDNLATYQYLQIASALPDLSSVIADALAGATKPRAASGESRQWFHPTIWLYLWNGLSRGIW